MNKSAVVAKVLVAAGICLLVLSIGAFPEQANAACDDCENLPDCVRFMPPGCGGTLVEVPGGEPYFVRFICEGGASCWLVGNCKCKVPIFGGLCHCG